MAFGREAHSTDVAFVLLTEAPSVRMLASLLSLIEILANRKLERNTEAQKKLWPSTAIRTYGALNLWQRVLHH